MIEALAFVKPAAWDALVTVTPGEPFPGSPRYPDDVTDPENPIPGEIIFTLPTLNTALSDEALRVYLRTVTGYWNTFTGGFEVYNFYANGSIVDEILAALGPLNVHAAYTWTQGTGIDTTVVTAADRVPRYETVPDDILAVMKDHVEYDETFTEISRTPATFESPNWGHMFLGQRERIFAGDFSTEFSEDFT